MPELITGEKQSDWMTRCVPQLIGEGKTHEQAVAQCMVMYDEFAKITDPVARGATPENPHGPVNTSIVNQDIQNIPPVVNVNIGKFKLETKDIKDVEIMREGMFKGKAYGKKELEQFKTNFDNKILEAYVTIDHDPKMTEETKKALKVASLGWVESLAVRFKDGVNRLVANFKQVPKLIAELIESGALKQKSIEFFKLLPREGKIYENVLEGVTFFGTGIPAVNGLSDLVQLFKSEKRDAQSGGVDGTEKDSIILFQEVPKMDQVTIAKAEYDELLKLKTSAQAVQEKFQESAAQVETFKTENATLKTKLETAEKSVAEFEKFKADSVKAEAEGFVDGIIKARKLAPKFRDMKVSEYVQFKADKAKLDLFKEEMESRAEIISGQLTNDKGAGIKTEFKTVEEADAELDRLMKSGKSAAEAMDIISGKAVQK